MSGGPISCFSKQGILLLLLSNLHYDVGVPLIINKRVGDSVDLVAGLESGHFQSLDWKYMGKEIVEFNTEAVYSPASQFKGRLKMNNKNFSLTVRELTLQDSGDFLLTGEGVKGQIGSKTITLKVHVLSTHIYSGHSEDDAGKAKAVLTIYPKSSQIFSGESVTLKCKILRGEVTDWEYIWRKDDVDTINRNHEYEISEVKISDNGDYRCLGSHIDNGTYSMWSDAVRLTVTALPTASVKIVTTQETLYSGDTVELRCDISNYTDWTYRWLINKEWLSSQTSKTTTISLSDQAGQYQCQGTRTKRPQNSYLSSSLHISVTALPTASVKASPRGPLYSGETVILQCDISDYRDWTYRWHRDNHLLPIPTSKTITISLPDQAGQYQCEGTRTRRPERTYLSSSLTIVVAALPKATLTTTPITAYNGETVTLMCSVGSDSGWSFTWYKDNTKNVVTSSGRHTTKGATFTIRRAAESDQGLYWCQGEIQSRSISSIISDPVTITVNERPVAVLTLQPNWPKIFSGETVTLSCDIQGEEEIE